MRLGCECVIPKTVPRGRPTRARQLEREKQRKKEEEQRQKQLATLQTSVGFDLQCGFAEEEDEEEDEEEGEEEDVEDEYKQLGEQSVEAF